MSNDDETLFEAIRQLQETGEQPPNRVYFVPSLWESVLRDALRDTTPQWVMDLPTKKPTFRQRLLYRWYRMTSWWPLMWKKNCDCEDY